MTCLSGWVLEAMILPQNEAMDHSSRTDVVFVQYGAINCSSICYCQNSIGASLWSNVRRWDPGIARAYLWRVHRYGRRKR